MRKSILLKFALTLCVFMQCVVLMPHHHHGNSAVSCINPMHPLAENSDCHGDSDCPQGHSHDVPLASCHFKQFVNIQPQRIQEHVEVTLCDLHYEAICANDHIFANDVIYTQSLLAWRNNAQRSLSCYLTRYLVRALPVRAPSCFV